MPLAENVEMFSLLSEKLSFENPGMKVWDCKQASRPDVPQIIQY